MNERADTASATTRRHFLDIILGASFLGWLVSIASPIIRYLKPLPQTGPTDVVADWFGKGQPNATGGGRSSFVQSCRSFRIPADARRRKAQSGDLKFIPPGLPVKTTPE